MAERPGGHLVRQIGLGSGVAVVVGSTIGSGIFKSPSDIAGQLPGPLPMLAVWIVGGVCVLCGALAMGELGSAFPYSGGQYVFLREAYGRLAGFLYGWTQLILIIPAGNGALAIVFAQYALRLAGYQEGSPDFDQKTAILAIAATVVTTAANVVGVKVGTGVQNLTTIAKSAGLLVLAALALLIALPRSGGHFAPAAPAGSFSMSAFGLALVSVLWVYDGWADGALIGGEILDPRRNVPKAIVLGTLGVIALYLLTNMAYLCVFPVGQIAKSSIIAADSMESLVGSVGVTFIVATVMISTFGTLSATLLTSPRVFFAMAEDRVFFQPLASVHPKFKTPHIAVIVSGCLIVVYVVVATAMAGSKAFGALTDAFVIGVVPFYMLSVGSLFIFRRRAKGTALAADGGELSDSLVDQADPEHIHARPHGYRPHVKTPLYPAVPILFIVAMLLLLANSLLDHDSRVPTIITLGLVLLGAPLFRLTIGRRTA